jgi:hypothetical protein
MSSWTAEGRKHKRDIKLEGVQRQMRRDKSLNALSVYQRGVIAELKLIGKDLYLDIRRRGVMLPDGTVNPAVEAHRKNCHEQVYSLSVYTDVKASEASAVVDIVAAMATRSEIETVVEQPAEGTQSVTEISSDECER